MLIEATKIRRCVRCGAELRDDQKELCGRVQCNEEWERRQRRFDEARQSP